MSLELDGFYGDRSQGSAGSRVRRAMPIAKPTRRLLRNVPLRFVVAGAAGAGRRTVNASLSLTTMIDFLLVTVVFLLITFSSSAEGAIAQKVTVPPADNTIDMIDAPVVAVFGGTLLLDGASAGTTREITEQHELRRLDDLASRLIAKRETWKQLHPGREFPGAVLLQIDQDTPALVVKSVFKTAASAGYPNVSFVVESGQRGGTRSR
jgi:biopolymer transport protein ExbD